MGIVEMAKLKDSRLKFKAKISLKIFKIITK